MNDGPNSTAAGIVGKAFIEFKTDDGIKVINIDDSWRVSKSKVDGWKSINFDDSGWKKANKIISLGMGPWGNILENEETIPEDFSHFEVPGNKKYCELLRKMFYIYYGTGTGGTLWDGWMVKSTVWPTGKSSRFIRRNYSKMLSSRVMNEEGYVSCHQHKGLAHNLGWPFPLWTQSGGVGWHFSVFGLPFGEQFLVYKTNSAKNWEFNNIENAGIDNKGMHLKIAEGKGHFTTPKFKVDPYISPFIALEWDSSGLDKRTVCYMEWKNESEKEFSKENRIYFQPLGPDSKDFYTMLPMYKISGWKGKITQLRFCFETVEMGSITIKKIYTSVDSRHNINNLCYLQGCIDYVNWTGDINFLRNNIQKMRKALRYVIDEFETQKYNCIFTPWVGHDGRSGIERNEDGEKKIIFGRGIGNNYWDLLPAGGKDTTATIYFYDVLRSMAQLEKSIANNPKWNVSEGPLKIEPEFLLEHSREVKNKAGEMFWNDKTGRFVMAVDVKGQSYDFGYTVLNQEAIYYGFATDRQAKSILDWISGKRVVNGDTSVKNDIYHWRFAPRASTRRNLDYYSFVWPAPENIPWGDQVQDGGAVLGFSYFDLMSRLKVYGADNAWGRLKEILDWFAEVQDEGGYRAYYSKPGRGNLQGGGQAGGLGMDQEFVESVLVPQLLLYGFMGVEPTLEYFSVMPDLPSEWDSMAIKGISYKNMCFDIKAEKESILFDIKQSDDGDLNVRLPAGKWLLKTNKAGACKTAERKVEVSKSNTAVTVAAEKGVRAEFLRVK
jgi:hypothetical protein